MKQFAYNLAYKCKNIWESEELSKYLEDLGHKKYGTLNYSIETPFIINRANNYSGSYCFNEEVKYHISPNREEIFDKELFLALAAQTLDKEFYPGELVIAIGDKKHTNTAKNGSIAKVTSEKYYSNICDTNLIDVEWIKTVPENCDQQNGGYWIDYFRKMTKEEIINYVQGKQKPMEIYQDYIVETNSIYEANKVVKYCKKRFRKDYSIAIKDKCWYRIDNSKSYYGYCQDLAWYKGEYPTWEIIDFNYWKQMIKQTNMTKKVIGYKLIKKYPGSPELGKIEFKAFDYENYLEFWEPQYAPEKKIITIPCEGGSFDVEISKDKMRIGNDTLNKIEVANLIDACFPETTGPNGWKIRYEVVSIGCKLKVKIQDLQMLKQEWDKING